MKGQIFAFSFKIYHYFLFRGSAGRTGIIDVNNMSLTVLYVIGIFYKFLENFNCVVQAFSKYISLYLVSFFVFCHANHSQTNLISMNSGLANTSVQNLLIQSI